MKADAGGLPRRPGRRVRPAPGKVDSGVAYQQRSHAVRSARSFSDEASLLKSFMSRCDPPAFDPSAWCAGIGPDVEREQFEEPWMEANPFKAWVQLPDAQTARALQDHLRGLGLNGDADGGDSRQPPTQVYVYRHPGGEPSFEG